MSKEEETAPEITWQIHGTGLELLATGAASKIVLSLSAIYVIVFLLLEHWLVHQAGLSSSNYSHTSQLISFSQIIIVKMIVSQRQMSLLDKQAPIITQDCIKTSEENSWAHQPARLDGSRRSSEGSRRSSNRGRRVT